MHQVIDDDLHVGKSANERVEHVEPLAAHLGHDGNLERCARFPRLEGLRIVERVGLLLHRASRAEDAEPRHPLAVPVADFF